MVVTVSKEENEARLEKEKLYVSSGEKTFYLDEKLPDLPVPSLHLTLQKYLDSVRPHVTDEEFAATEAVANAFEDGVGKRLHHKLLERARNQRNWLERWWEDVIYLSVRQPLIPFLHMGGSFGLYEMSEEYTGPRSYWTARNLYFYLCFWKLIKKEQLKPQAFRKMPWTMHQFRRLFNTARIPQQGRDILVTKFQTEEEGSSPTNVVVLCNGHVFSFDAVDEDGEPLSVAELAHQFDHIETYCAQEGEGPGVGALTVGHRDTWGKNRELLKKLHSKNDKHLQTIEDALLVVALDKSSPTKRSEVLSESIKGDCTNRWADKSYTLIVFKNCTIGSSADHTPFDGMVPLSIGHYAHLSCLEDRNLNGYKTLSPPSRTLPVPEKLEFTLNDYLTSEIETNKEEQKRLCENVEVYCSLFTGFGKEFLKPLNLHPEAFFQIALQMAYYRLHGRPAPTYTTASTRGFYHGRTETCRACTPETMEFVKAVLEESTPPMELLKLLKKAVEKFNTLMIECCKNQGCDRHLLGLAMIAVEEGLPMPEIFLDPSFTKSGGNGSFVLSTSSNGYTPLIGGVAPMCPNGYGCFYSIENKRMTIAITTFKENPETDGELLFKSIERSLQDLQHLLLSAKL